MLIMKILDGRDNVYHEDWENEEKFSKNRIIIVSRLKTKCRVSKLLKTIIKIL